ncbi:MAG: GntR family transcriptional regulator [Gammaproteobacteria bacterium]|nr:GntR family transcriptional regulator [Gammaproteobacteria bacterium]
MDPLFGQHLRERLNPADRSPLYHQIFMVLRNHILDGTLPFGMQLPTEEQLASVFEVSRITAKRAMDELASEELVERKRGRGSHVVYRYTQKPVTAPLIGMLQEIESMARNSIAIVLECAMLPPPQDIRVELELREDEPALHLVRVRERESRKFGYYVSWTAGVAEPQDPSIFVTEPRLSYFRRNGLELTHVTQTLSAAVADSHIASALDIRENSPLLTLTRRSYNKIPDGEVLRDLLLVSYNPDHFQYKMDLKID